MSSFLITGASSGIGKALANKAAEQGHSVIACGRNAERLNNLNQANIETLQFDCTDKQDCTTALKNVSADIVVFNAGTCEYLDVDNFDSGIFERVFNTNIMGTVYVLEALLEQLKPGAQLVFIDSLARMLPFTKAQAYGASKAALNYLARSLETDLSDKHITIQTVSPGFVKTPLTDRNEFSMPMRITAEKAADIIYQGVINKKRDIRFPFTFSVMISLMACLPSALQVKLCQRMT